MNNAVQRDHTYSVSWIHQIFFIPAVWIKM